MVAIRKPVDGRKVVGKVLHFSSFAVLEQHLEDTIGRIAFQM
jgi:hypothetical protein